MKTPRLVVEDGEGMLRKETGGRKSLELHGDIYAPLEDISTRDHVVEKKGGGEETDDAASTRLAAASILFFFPSPSPPSTSTVRMRQAVLIICWLVHSLVRPGRWRWRLWTHARRRRRLQDPREGMQNKGISSDMGRCGEPSISRSSPCCLWFCLEAKLEAQLSHRPPEKECNVGEQRQRHGEEDEERGLA